MNAAELLAGHDAQLRIRAETPGAIAVVGLGPLRLVDFPGGRGLVTYRDLGGADADGIRALVEAAVDHFRCRPGIDRVEWKTRGHDHAPGLPTALRDNGFHPEETETIMLGPARALAVEVDPPSGVTLRTVTAAADVAAMCAVCARVFGAGPVRASDGKDAAAQRLHLLVPTHPATRRIDPGLHDHPLPVVTPTRRELVGRTVDARGPWAPDRWPPASPAGAPSRQTFFIRDGPDEVTTMSPG